MKVKNPSTGNFEEIYVKALDSLPVGSEIDFTGSASDIPVGWEQVDSPVNMITVRGSGSTEMTTTDSETKQIPLNVNIAQVGNKLTFDNANDCIVIGEGISYVSISAGACIQLNSNGMTYQTFNIYKNNSALDIIAQIRQQYSPQTYTFTNLADVLIPVNAGDKISIRIFNRLAGNLVISGQYLSVKVIA